MALLQRVADWFTEPRAPRPSSTPIAVAKSARAAGTDGVSAYGGYVNSGGEANSELVGSAKWVTYANTQNTPIVSTGIRYFGNLLAGTKWHAEPNKAGGADAVRGAEIVTEGLLNAQMAKPWALVVRKAAMYRMNGFSIHATGIKRRPDGMIVFSEIAHRPVHTIERWLRRDETSAWDAVEQRTESGGLYKIDLDECFYCVDDTLTDSPEGVGALRHVVEHTRRLAIFEALEGMAFQSDMGGMPVGWVPLRELHAAAESRYQGSGPTVEAQRAAWVTAQLAPILGNMENRIKTPEVMQYLALDSDTYRGTDKNPTGIKKWGLELLAGQTNGLPEINETIKRVEFQVARVLGVEFALIGADGGSYSMHSDKTSMLATTLSVTLDEMSAFATTQLARRLVRLNGLDPDTATPTLVAEPIATDSVLEAAQALAAINGSGTHPRDKARNVLRTRLKLPPEPDADELGGGLAPRVPMPPAPDEVDDADDESTDDPDVDEIDDAEDVEGRAA